LLCPGHGLREKKIFCSLAWEERREVKGSRVLGVFQITFAIVQNEKKGGAAMLAAGLIKRGGGTNRLFQKGERKPSHP